MRLTEELMMADNKKIVLNCEDCKATMAKMIDSDIKIDCILTSPPYNTSRAIFSKRGLDNHEGRYDVFNDNKTDEEYREWTLDIFKWYNRVLANNGVVLYNLSYSSERTELMWLVISDIIQKTPFTVVDDIIWKKKSALPNNTSSNKLTRITEHILVFCRKKEFKTFMCNKKIKSQSKTGQLYYENVFNFIEANNNDGSCPLNKATFSSDLVQKLLNIYATENATIYDSFMGTGTTALACYNLGMECYGSELSQPQWEYSINRIKDEEIKKIRIYDKNNRRGIK